MSFVRWFRIGYTKKTIPKLFHHPFWVLKGVILFIKIKINSLFYCPNLYFLFFYPYTRSTRTTGAQLSKITLNSKHPPISCIFTPANIIWLPYQILGVKPVKNDTTETSKRYVVVSEWDCEWHPSKREAVLLILLNKKNCVLCL